MKIDRITKSVRETTARLSEERVRELKEQVKDKKPRDLVSSERMALRQSRLSEADFRPSQVDRERIMGTNDLVDVNYLMRAQLASKAVCRIILRDAVGREIGYGTGFKVSPRVLMTNQHVLEDAALAAEAVAEFGYELDVSGRPSPTTRFRLKPSALFVSDEELDFAITAIDPEPLLGDLPLDAFGFLRMQPETGKVNVGEFVTIIQHPSGLPKQIALRENQLLAIEDLVLWYQSDTAQGSSGSAVLNDSWQIVALHHSGVPKTDGQGRWLTRDGKPAGADTDDGDIDWVANEGIRISRIIARIRQGAAPSEVARELERAVTGEVRPEDPRSPNAPPLVPHPSGGGGAFGMGGVAVEAVPGGARIFVPLSFDIQFSGTARAAGLAVPSHVVAQSALVGGVTAVEKLPVIDTSYGDRKGYDADFLGVRVALPKIKNEARVSRMDNGDCEIPYQHFSIVMDKARRLALLTASNVDGSKAARQPEPGRDYTRKALGGFGENDKETWLTDPRIPEQHQLPDAFYNEDRQAFDKGHLVRRDDVCFGKTYAMVQRANGDTYHTTNCSPQRKDFNQSMEGGIWGELENLILKQAQAERYCLFAAPLLRQSDPLFVGVDARGPVKVQIPLAFWKVVVARVGNELQSFGFLLEQDLKGVKFEFSVSAKWKRKMVSIGRLQARIGAIEFPKAVLDADQFKKKSGNEIAGAAGFDPDEDLDVSEADAGPANGG